VLAAARTSHINRLTKLRGGGDSEIMLGLHTPPATPSSGQPVIGKRRTARADTEAKFEK